MRTRWFVVSRVWEGTLVVPLPGADYLTASATVSALGSANPASAPFHLELRWWDDE